MDYPELSFETPDTVTFPALTLAYEAMKAGGNMPCILCAANDMAVEAFLGGQIAFRDIPDTIETALSGIDHIHNPSLEDIYQTDIQTRQFVHSFLKKQSSI